MLQIAQDRLKTLSDLNAITGFFFFEPKIDISLITENKQLKNIPSSELANILKKTVAELDKINDFSAINIQEALNQLLQSLNLKPVVLFSIIRIATSWAAFSPELPSSLAIIGKEKTINRINNSAEYLEK